jgi:prenyltransferase beta subunit
MKTRSGQLLFSLLTTFLLIFSSVSSSFAIPIFEPVEQNEANATIRAGFSYLASEMNNDGGIRWMDETSDPATTLRLVLALAASGYGQEHMTSDAGNRPIDFLGQVADDWINQSSAEQPSFSTARAGQLITAIAAANENPFDFGANSSNLIHAIKTNYDPNTGVYGTANSENVLDQVWAIIGLAANHASIPKEAVAWLVDSQTDDGSWNDGYGSYLDTTPLAVMALIASGFYEVNSPEIQAAIEFLQANQQSDGGWKTEWDSSTNANTTGIILQAVSAMGQDPTQEDWQKPDGNPHTALLALQGENGVIGGDFANTYSTVDAILGLTGNPLFNLGYLKRINHGFEFIVASQQSDGGWGSIGQTIDVMIALHAAGWDPNTIINNENTPLSFISANLETYLSSGPDAIGKTILAVVVSGEDPSNFTNIDLVTALRDTYNEALNSFGDPENTWHQALAILGLSAADVNLPEGVVETLLQLQREDGGWEYTSGYGTWPDNTALAIQSLLAAGVSADDEVISKALDYIQSLQNEDGDWEDSSTTSYVLMALNALDISPDQWAVDNGYTPLSKLFSYQKMNGAFVYNWEFVDDNLMSTSTALMAALSGDYLVTPPGSENNNFAGLVIVPNIDNVKTACIKFSQESISGLELIDESGIAYEAQDGFMNSIMDIVNPDGGTMYWSYWHWDGRDWVFNNTGASDTKIRHSSIEAWAFVSWEVFPSTPPSFTPNLNEICGFSVLKDHRIQPVLNYKDLITVAMDTEPISEIDDDHTPDEVVVEEKVTPTEAFSETESSATAISPPAQTDETRSKLPLFIISAAGISLVAVILIILLRKRT